MDKNLKKNSMNPKVTVLMPVYNAEAYLKESIESILNQTFTDFEFLIVNDASSDKSVEIIESYKLKDSRIVLIDNSEGKGVAGAANTGFKAARGQYIARMDSDDISLPNRLHEQVKFLDSNPEVGVLGSWVKLFGIHNNNLWNNPTTDAEIKTTMLFFGAISNPTTMFRKKVIFENNVFYNKVVAEDYDLFVRLREFTKFANLPQVLLRYRTHTTNIGTVQRVQQNESANLIREKLLKELNIKYSNEEWATHLKICYGEYHNDKQYLIDSMNWINRILEVNKKQNLYNQKLLTKVAYNIWLDLYAHTKYLATDILRKNFNFSLINKAGSKYATKMVIEAGAILTKNLLKNIYGKS